MRRFCFPGPVFSSCIIEQEISSSSVCAFSLSIFFRRLYLQCTQPPVLSLSCCSSMHTCCMHSHTYVHAMPDSALAIESCHAILPPSLLLLALAAAVAPILPASPCSYRRHRRRFRHDVRNDALFFFFLLLPFFLSLIPRFRFLFPSLLAIFSAFVDHIVRRYLHLLPFSPHAGMMHAIRFHSPRTSPFCLTAVYRPSFFSLRPDRSFSLFSLLSHASV